MDKPFYRKKRFWVPVVAALAATGVLTGTQSETALRIIAAIFGG